MCHADRSTPAFGPFATPDWSCDLCHIVIHRLSTDIAGYPQTLQGYPQVGHKETPTGEEAGQGGWIP